MAKGRKFGNPELVVREFSLYPEFFKLLGKEFQDALKNTRISVSEYGWCDFRERDLSIARNKELLFDSKIEGNYVGVVQLTGTADLRFNNPQSAAFPLATIPEIYGIPYNRLFLTNVAQSGVNLVLLIGKGNFHIDRIAMQGMDLQAQYTIIIDSTTTNLAANAPWTSSDWFDATNYGYITVLASADVTGTLYLQHSNDGVNIHDETRAITTLTTLSTGATLWAATIMSARPARYVRASFVNGAGVQSSFSLMALARVVG